MDDEEDEDKGDEDREYLDKEDDEDWGSVEDEVGLEDEDASVAEIMRKSSGGFGVRRPNTGGSGGHR